MKQPTWIGHALALTLCLGLAGAACQPETAARKNSQVQVAQQFLLEVLGQNPSRAYPLLAPATREKLTLAEFQAQAQPLAALGARRGPAIALYKLGARLPADAGQQTEYFVAFAWAADSASARRLPAEWLEVTFPDTASRQIQGFWVRGRR